MEEDRKKHDANMACYKDEIKLAEKEIIDFTKRKAENKAKKQELESLTGLSYLDRIDTHYKCYVEAMQKGSAEDEYKYFAEQFRLLEGYKDSGELAAKCDRLADECGKRVKKAHYDDLVQAKNSASSEEKYKQLAVEFREMGTHENAAQLADECGKQYRILKERREEQERIEKQRKEETQRREAEERERCKAEERERERIKAEKVKRKQTIGIALQFGMLIAFLYVLWGTNLISSILIPSIGSFNLIPFLLIPAVLSLVLGIISLLFRKDVSPILPWGIPWGTVFLIFGLAAATVTVSVWNRGSIAMGVISVILMLIPTGLLYHYFDDDGDIGGGIGYTILAVVVSSIVGLIVGLISEFLGSGDYGIFIFMGLAVPAMPGMFMMHKAENG
jgi:hypothetical protein